MKIPFRHLFATLFCMFAASECGGIEIGLSVKFIRSSSGVDPVTVAGTGNIDLSSSTAFDVEVAHGNRVLDESGRGFRLRVVEYRYIQPLAPVGANADYWYNIDARNERPIIEGAASVDPVTWAWNSNGVINIYVNNSNSGSCSFFGTGVSISLGATIFSRGTVLHEIAHFFDLRHTHAGDPVRTGWAPPNPLSSGLSDGDGLNETLPDHPFYSIDQLSQANFGSNYADLNNTQRAAIDATWNNLMSYHEENRVLGAQMDIWAEIANDARKEFTVGSTWFVIPGGFDQAGRGLARGQAFATLNFALSRVTNSRDVVLLRSATYQAPATAINTRCILCATDGPVTLTRP